MHLQQKSCFGKRVHIILPALGVVQEHCGFGASVKVRCVYYKALGAKASLGSVSNIENTHTFLQSRGLSQLLVRVNLEASLEVFWKRMEVSPLSLPVKKLAFDSSPSTISSPMDDHHRRV